MIIKFFLKYLFIGFVFFTCSLLSGCSLFNDSKNKIIYAKLTIISGKQLNPAINGEPSPLVVRVYQLSQIDKFDNSDFFTLYAADQSALSNDLQSQLEIEVKPNDKIQKQLEVGSNTRFIAILAAFRSLDNAQWKDIKAFDIQKKHSIIIYLNGNTAKLEIN